MSSIINPSTVGAMMSGETITTRYLGLGHLWKSVPLKLQSLTCNSVMSSYFIEQFGRIFMTVDGQLIEVGEADVPEWD